MPEARAALETLILDRRSDEPLQRQLYAELRRAILDGRLAGGLLLPSTRTLAGDVGVARNTVVAVFEQLASEGYLEARIGAGTRVARVMPETMLEARRARPGDQTMVGAGTPPALSRRGVAMSAVRRPVPPADRRAFQPGMPALDLFPHEVWARVVARRTRQPGIASLGYTHAVGHPALREAIAAHVGAARGVVCTPEQVVVTAGAQAGLDLAAQLLLDPGDVAWIEEPGYLGARGALTRAGARLVPVPVDADGLDVAAGVRDRPPPRLVYVTPSHQFPTGATLTLARRLALLEHAGAAGAWVLEDDYDSEYRYAGRPLAAMQGIDRGGRVVYVGTFSKTMFPALRAGYLIVPPALADACATAMRLTGHTVPTAIQLALADFIGEGLFTAHVRRMRTRYAERRARLLRGIARHVGAGLEILPAQGGMQVAARLPAGTDDVGVAAATARAGLVTPPLSVLHLGAPRTSGLFLGFAGVPEREIDAGVTRLARVLEREL